MNISEESRQRLAAEVVELGESLFETALDAASHKAVEGGEDVAYPTEEIRAAANEFFVALRLLLGVSPNI